MKTAVAIFIIVFTGLFVLTTFPPAPESHTQAAREYFTEEEIDTGWRLAVQRKLIFWAGSFLTLGFFLVLACTGRARRLADRFERWSGGRWWLTVLLMGAFCFLVERALRFPLGIISLENWRAWGMTQRDLLDWLIDYGKGLALTAGMGAVLLVGLYALIRWFPRVWWLLATGLGGLAAVGFVYILPIWIEPLFNTFTPLAEYQKLDAETKSRLETSIRELADRAGVPVQEVLVKDASRQSNHTNAYFTGFGATRRIVLFDTLLDAHPVAEVESILAHEIGHWLHHHIVTGLTLGLLGAMVGLFLLSVILRWAVNRRPFLLKSPADPAGWPLILLLSFLATWLLMPVENAVSRHFERQADWTALELTADPEVFIQAEKRLARDNKSNLTPNRLSVWWFASHPPAVERIGMAHQWKAKQ